MGRLNKDEELKLRLRIIKLFNEGMTAYAIHKKHGISWATLNRWNPKNQKPLVQPILEFPVHPTVEMAKNRLMGAFSKGDFAEFAKAQLELKNLVDLHHPPHTRPLGQVYQGHGSQSETDRMDARIRSAGKK